MNKVAMPPHNAESRVRLPGIVHTEHAFVRPFVQLDYDVFRRSMLSRAFQERLAIDNGRLPQHFVGLLNSYKQGPLVLVAVVDRMSFTTMGSLALLDAGENEVEILLDIPTSYAAEVAAAIVDYYRAYRLRFVCRQQELWPTLRTAGFHYDEDASTAVRDPRADE